MTKKQKELMERAIGVIEGIALVANKDVREALYVAIEMLDEVSDGNKNDGGRVDALATAELCIEAFKKDHNTEHLVDAANYLMFRYMYPMPGEYFKATDSDGSVGTVGTPINLEKDWD